MVGDTTARVIGCTGFDGSTWSLEFDASAAVRAGLVGVLVRTGKWKPGAVDGLDPKPTFEFSNLQQAVDRLLS